MKIPDYVLLEMRMAELMSQQEASGFRFDMDAAIRVRTELQGEFDTLAETIKSKYLYILASSHLSVQTRRRVM